MKRTPLRRRSKPRRSQSEVEASAWFKCHFARSDCAMCGTAWSYPDVHHVVSQQELKRRGRQDLLWDPRNGLPLCSIGSWHGNGCHEAHENGSSRIPLSCLTGPNMEFASEVLGDYAMDYLFAHYRSSIVPDVKRPGDA